MQICNANHIEVGQEKQCTLVDQYNSESTGGRLIYNNHQTECKTKSPNYQTQPRLAQIWHITFTDTSIDN